MARTPIVVLEVGTSRTAALLGILSDKSSGPPAVVAASVAKTSGMRKSEVVAPQSVSTTVASVLKRLSESGDVDINQLDLVYSGGDLQGMPISGHVAIQSDYSEVHEQDVAAAIAQMRDTPLPDGRTTLEDIKCNYVLDGRRIVEDPISLTASELVVNGIRTHVDSNSVRALIDAVEFTGVGVATVFSTAASAPLGCTTAEQRRNGVLVIDLGGGTTSWSVTRKDKVAAVGHLAIGGDHVTNDILCAFHTGKDESAAELKHTVAQATLEGVDPAEQIPVPKMLGIGKRIKLRSLAMVVNARLDEMLRIIRDDVQAVGGLDGLGAGIVLCGGGALLHELPTLVTRVFDGVPCTVGALPPLDCPVIDDDPENIRYAAAYGALLQSARMHRDMPVSRGGIRERLFNLIARGGGRP
ncbi:MAG: cell division protein FtsA [Kiritimatiellia bacterium]|jgi:cell division protein FtsA